MPSFTLTPPGTQNGSPPATAPRMSWLDALRGLAALVVVFEHSLDVLLPEVRRAAGPWFDFGRYGVFVFFLVSGYVVPFSLERRGSVREFWIGRFFRLYPAWLVSVALAVVLGAAGISWGLPDALRARPWTSVLAHLTMLQDLLGVPNAVNVFWTLSYEMVFYLLVTAMFLAGVHRASARVALGFGVAAAMLGVALPTALLAARWPGGTTLVAAPVLAGGLAALVSRRRAVRRAGIAVVAGLALTLLVLDSRIGGVESLCIIATMFAGTAVRGIEDGRLRAWPAAAMVAVVPVLSLLAGLRPPTAWAAPGGTQSLGLDWSLAVAAAWLTFLGGFALRRRSMPRALVWSGLVSYSLYLLHPLVVQTVWRASGDPGGMPGIVRLGWGVVLVAAVLVSAGLAHRYVERPAQRLGRRLARRGRPPAPA
ncbi:acyltransferase family protein, partial [Actinomadura rubrisoli]